MDRALSMLRGCYNWGGRLYQNAEHRDREQHYVERSVVDWFCSGLTSTSYKDRRGQQERNLSLLLPAFVNPGLSAGLSLLDAEDRPCAPLSRFIWELHS